MVKIKELQSKLLREWEFYSAEETCERPLSDIMLVELDKINVTVCLKSALIFDLLFWKIGE